MDEARTMLAGRYELAEVIGRGGMGTVYRAVDQVLGRSVAVKMLPGSLADRDPTSVQRFEREARAAAALNHPAVVAVYDAGDDAAVRFIVMELVAGRSLEAIIRDGDRLDPARAADIAARVADALAAAHAAGIVHRDVKPANVMIADDGSVKVLDFGIARAIDGTALTQNSSVLGTAAYMAPEQALGKLADQRSDIYSLGCVLYALLVGHPPFTGDSAAAILHQHVNVVPPPPRAENGRVSPALDEVVMRMLAKSADDRPQTAAEVRDRLATAAVSPRATATPTTAATLPLPRTPRSHSRRRLIFAVAAAAVALLVAVIALTTGGSPRHPPTGVRHGSGVPAAAGQKRSPVTAAASTALTTPTTSTAPAKSKPAAPRTVSGAAGALTALATQDTVNGTIDQQAAQQITHGLSDIVNSYDTGNIADAQHKLSDLSQQVAMLQQQGHITASAAPALDTAVANLAAALGSAPASATPAPAGQPPAQPGPPPGHGGQPPGHAKHGGPKSH